MIAAGEWSASAAKCSLSARTPPRKQAIATTSKAVRWSAVGPTPQCGHGMPWPAGRC